ncbi:MAG: sigma-54-dependent transcriptional regulator [Blastocatellia bacterium]
MSEPLHILVADDEPSIRLLLETGLSLNGFRVTSVRSGSEALEAARAGDFAAVISDIFMPDGDGLAFARELRALKPRTPLTLMTAHGSVELAVQAVAEGARDFIAKPFEMAAMADLLKRVLHAQREAEAALGAASGAASQLDELAQSRLIGRCPAMVRVYKLIAHAARTDATVLICGESGTGKELVARAIHDFSARAERPFIAVNCSGLTDTLLEAELFGHTRGAFTGANADRAGLFEAADGGTIFLDELALTSATFQASLLRALQSGEVRRIGSTLTRRVNVRVVGASNMNLRELAAAGGFRLDLFYRLSVLTIDLPPLRQRPGDAPLLARHFLGRLGEKDGASFRLTEEAAAALGAHAYPGNVRELENALIHAAALSHNGLITLDCLPPHIAAAETGRSEGAGMIESLHALAADWPAMEELQRRYLQLALDKVRGNRRQAASLLGMNRRTIQRLIAKHQFDVPRDDEADAADFDETCEEGRPDQD